MEDRLFLRFYRLLKTSTVEATYGIKFLYLKDRPLTFQVLHALITVDLFCLA